MRHIPKGARRIPVATLNPDRSGWEVVTNGVEVINFSASTPRCLEKHVAKVLRCVRPSDLEGLGQIWLDDRLPPSVLEEPRYREALSLGEPFYGWYRSATPGESAGIFLHTSDVLQGLPRFFWPTPAGTVLIGRTLAHEIGHHVITTSGARFSDETAEELEANKYAMEILLRMERRQRYSLAVRFLMTLGERQLTLGKRQWENGNHRKALYHFSRANSLWTKRGDDRDWYVRARQECLTGPRHCPASRGGEDADESEISDVSNRLLG
jgi:hypothetical protein